MTDEADIWRAAKLLVDQHGAEAPIHAAMRADELLAEGDVEGQLVWKLILNAAHDLLRARDGDPVH